ncbi:MAG TPA: hypothetical protein VNZ58_13750 [Thermomicrobiales bacterium]|nr:hypothetical protein [Thermomicrobiales bacterium]
MSFRSRLIDTRIPALALSAMLALGLTAPVLAQDDATAPSETTSETAAQLPAANLPSMNAQGFVFEIESDYNGTFSPLPDEAPVYTMSSPTVDEDQAKSIAEGLGIDGDVDNKGEGTFNIAGDGGSLFITPGMMQYISDMSVPEGDVPNDDQAVAFAREWLRQVKLLPANVGEGTVQTRIENPPRVVVSFQPVKPAPLLSASPNITVTMGPNGSILESTYQWADISQGDVFQLRGTDSAWDEVKGRRAYVQTELPTDTFEPGSTITGHAEYTNVSLAYTISGLPGEKQYLQPVYVFTGKLTPEGSEKSYTVTSYVPALINNQQPVG